MSTPTHTLGSNLNKNYSPDIYPNTIPFAKPLKTPNDAHVNIVAVAHIVITPGLLLLTQTFAPPMRAIIQTPMRVDTC